VFPSYQNGAVAFTEH